MAADSPVPDVTSPFHSDEVPQATTQDYAATGYPGRIGPYKILQELGSGGMGTVFLAEQTEPVRRRVALKLIRAGLHSSHLIARFEAERQALALMDHPNIARVLDAGAAPDGRPYLAMEFVPGVPITRFCDDRKLTPRERLDLFVPVCQAVQHAHQKGVIHRDIKPTNVLVAIYDGKLVPKVIDFGVAKAAEQVLTDRTLHTQFGAVVGTFEYMSPEQAEASPLGVDTRTDIYSLGVLLYELLTGETPIDRTRLKQVSFSEAIRMIREDEPARPSTRLSTVPQLEAVATARRVNPPGRLSRLLRGELDWIVMKCLEKDRARRYETANALARDLQRFLADEAVEAGPPSVRYRLGKMIRRNKTPITAAVGFFLLLVAGVAVSVWQAVRAEDERERAVQSQKTLRLALTREVADRMEADLFRLSTVGESLAATVEQGDNWDEGRFDRWMRRMMENEPQIFGLCLAFEPDTFDPRPPDDRRRRPFAGLVPFGLDALHPLRDGYSLYVYRKRPEGVIVTEPLQIVYRYREQEWYREGMTGKRTGWDEPYLDMYGGDIPMVSYVTPLRLPGNKKSVGAMTVDLSLEYFGQLAAWLKELDFGEDAYGFVISGQGRVISHPRLAFESLLPSKGDKLTRIQDVWSDEAAFHTMIQDRVLPHRGKSVGQDVCVDPATGRTSRFLYAKFSPAGWVFVAVIPEAAP